MGRKRKRETEEKNKKLPKISQYFKMTDDLMTLLMKSRVNSTPIVKN